VIGAGVRPGMAVALVILVAGCSREPDSKDGAANMREGRSVVVTQVRAAAKALTVGDTRAVDVKGGFEGCGGGGISALRVRYVAGGSIEGGAGTASDRVRAAMVLLRKAGWRITDNGPSDASGAYGQLIRDGVKLTVDEDELEGSDGIGFGAATLCFDVTHKQYDNLPGKEQIAP
jgi:hypothetical protein